tara:strand:- start:1673 stop:1951 length:279 start_codon:yes stop_codon:yes gene_type:complete
MNTCNKCQGKFTWAKPYTGDKIPVGDNPCSCENHSAAPKSAGGAPRVEVPIEQIVSEIEAIKAAIGEIVDTTSENVMVEGIWKFAISRKMSR